MSEKLWFLKKCPLFVEVSERDLQRVEGASRARVVERGHPIYLPADAAETVYLLASGCAKICHLTADGKQSLLALIEPGELFGELALFEPGQREEYAEAVERSTVVQIPAAVIHDLLASHPQVSLGVTKLFGLRRRRIERRLKNLLFYSNRERLTHLLLELAEQYGVRGSDGIRLRIQLSHQDLANVIGSTRETVTVVLGEMQQEGLIRIGRRKLWITDADRLARSVQRTAPELPAASGGSIPGR
jgi:CRP-like cAMP-binding protein